jgi:hypothetical protein
MLGKFFDKFCFNTLFLIAAILTLGGLQLPSVFNADEGGKMTGPNPVLPKTIGLWTRSDSPKIVTAKNIFDYMNGAGELYLGYRFDRLDVYQYNTEKQKEILVELYYMKTPDDAFGLLSLDWGGDSVNLTSASQNEESADFAWPRALYGEGLLRLWTENIYARVMATQETPESKQAVLSIGRAIVKGRKNIPSPNLMNKLKNTLSRDWHLRRDRIHFLRTRHVLNSLYYLSHQNILDLDLECEAVAAQYENGTSPEDKIRIQFLLVYYSDSNSAKRALAHFHEVYLPDHPFMTKTGSSGEIAGLFSVEDGWMAYSNRTEYIAFVFECPDEKTARAVLDQMH